MLSVLAYDDAHARVRGLASFPKADRTPLALPVRLSFLGMVGIGTYLIALSSGTGCAAAGGRGSPTAGRCSRSPPPGRSRSSPTSSAGWSPSSVGSRG